MVIADDLELPFSSRLKWSEFSLRFGEKESLANPLGMLKKVRAVPKERVVAMQAAVLRARPSFLWHLDPGRRSAVDEVLQEMCDAKG